MKCTNKRTCGLLFLILLLFFCEGCGRVSYEMPYTASSEISSFRIVNQKESSELADPFAKDICVAGTDGILLDSVDMSRASAAGLFDINRKNTIYAKNIHEKLYPASLTKVMTALEIGRAHV